MLTEKELCYHTSKVYELIAFMLVSYFGGFYLATNLKIYNGYIDLNFVLSSILSFVLLLIFLNSKSSFVRFYTSLGMSGLMGSTLSYISWSTHIDNSILLFAIISTLTLFAGLTFAAKFTDNYKSMMSSSIIAIFINICCCMQLLSFYYSIDTIVTVQITTGLLMFSSHVMYDTETMHKEFQNGNFDYYKNAMMLFLDFINIFTKILTLLIKNNKSKKTSQKNKN